MNINLKRDLITGDYYRNNPLPDISYKEYVLQDFDDSKCSYCNSALHDCSLCDVLFFDNAENGEPIC